MCLILDYEEGGKVCTEENYDATEGETIVLKPANGPVEITKVDLKMQREEPGQIADLKIYYGK